MQLSVIQFH